MVNTYTENFNLAKPDNGDVNWHIPINDNFDTIDTQMSYYCPTGSIIMYGTNVAPSNWLLCDGSAVSRTTYATLFAVIGTIFGEGDGSTTFNLPDIRDRFVVGAGSTYENGNMGGEATHVLTIDEMPAHTHTVNISSASREIGGENAAWTGTVTNTGSAGGDEPHNNLPPYVALSFIIKT